MSFLASNCQILKISRSILLHQSALHSQIKVKKLIAIGFGRTNFSFNHRVIVTLFLSTNSRAIHRKVQHSYNPNPALSKQHIFQLSRYTDKSPPSLIPLSLPRSGLDHQKDEGPARPLPGGTKPDNQLAQLLQKFGRLDEAPAMSRQPSDVPPLQSYLLSESSKMQRTLSYFQCTSSLSLKHGRLRKRACQARTVLEMMETSTLTACLFTTIHKQFISDLLWGWLAGK